MSLSVPCGQCGRPIAVRPDRRDRLSLARALGGEEFRLPCRVCGAVERYHVDEVTASAQEARLWGLVVGLAVAGGFTALLWEWGWVSTLTFILFGGIYYAFQHDADRKADAFNGYRLRR